jgi:hypothetical protein
LPYKDPEKRREMNRLYLQRFLERNPGYGKRWRESNPERIARAVQKMKQRPWYSATRSAYALVQHHLKTGKLIRPDACEGCGIACKPDAAHADYSKPLEVRWLCRSCHTRWDKAEPKTPAE